jgi:putative ABC transport system substrate-binding protein
MNLAADDPEALGRITAFVQGLQQLGWTDGRNVRIDARWAAGNADNLRKYAQTRRDEPSREGTLQHNAHS